jgi:hypothetical protein
LWGIIVPELLLASGVEDVEHAGDAVDGHLHAVGVLDGGVVVIHEAVVDKLDREGRLAHTTGTHHHELVFNWHVWY